MGFEGLALAIQRGPGFAVWERKRERMAKMKVVIERMTVEALGRDEGGRRRCSDEESKGKFSSKLTCL